MQTGNVELASLRQRALRLLATREHTRAELTRKLSGQATQDDIALVLDALQNDGLLSDERFAASYVRTHAARLGRARLAQTLRAKGVSADLANHELDSQLNQDGQSDELERACLLWARKFGNVPADAREWARQARFLQFRGFSSEVVRKVLRDAKLAGDQMDSRVMDEDNQS
ncbi:MAG: regulatory protein RecX [Rhodocyclaceae bacterium]|nr:regulatory protein RecX [Rhodocyclaceae bacterium]